MASLLSQVPRLLHAQSTLHMSLVMDGKWRYCFPSIYLLFCTLYYPNYAMNTLWNLLWFFSWQMKLDFRLRFTRVARAVHRDPLASLFICQRFSLLHFPMRTKAIFDDTQSYSVLDFPSTKPPLNSKRRTRVGNLQRVRHLGSFR